MNKSLWRWAAEKIMILHKTSNWAAGRTGRTYLQCCGARSSTFSNTCSEQYSLDWHRAPRCKKTVPCTKQFLTMAFNPTNNIFFKTKIFLLYKTPKPKWIIHSDLQSTQEYIRGKICSVNYQQFCPFIFSIRSNLECSRQLFCCQLFFSLLGDLWFIGPFTALWKWYRFNFFLYKLPLILTLQRVWRFLKSW